MGLFNRLGRKTEELKQQMRDAQAEQATHQCHACEERLYTDHETCPECGSADVRPI